MISHLVDLAAAETIAMTEKERAQLRGDYHKKIAERALSTYLAIIGVATDG